MVKYKERDQSNAGNFPIRSDSAFSVLYGLSDVPVLTFDPLGWQNHVRIFRSASTSFEPVPEWKNRSDPGPAPEHAAARSRQADP